MENKNFSSLSTEELLKKQNSMKVSAALFTGILIVLIAASTYLTLQKGFGGITILPVALMPILFSIFKNSKKIKAELNSRKQ